MKIASLLLIAAAIAWLIHNGINAIRGRKELDAARRENEALKSRREALRDEAFRLGARANEELERRHLPARSARLDRDWRAGRLPPPARSASSESIIAWLSSEGAQLQSLAVDLSPDDERPEFQPDPRHRDRPGVDRDMHRMRQFELPEGVDTNIAERQLRKTGDSS